MNRPSFDQIIDAYVHAATADAAQRRVRSATFWSSFGFAQPTQQHVERVRSALAERGIILSTTAGTHGDDAPDGWVLLTPTPSPSAVSILTLPDAVFASPQPPSDPLAVLPSPIEAEQAGAPSSGTHRGDAGIATPAALTRATCPACGGTVMHGGSFCVTCGRPLAPRHASVPAAAVDVSGSDHPRVHRSTKGRAPSGIDLKSKFVLGLAAFMLLFKLLGVYMPFVLVGVGALLGLAWYRPQSVSSAMSHRLFQRLPATLVSSPKVLVVVATVVLVPLAMLAGRDMYELSDWPVNDNFGAVGTFGNSATATWSAGSSPDVPAAVCGSVAPPTAQAACRAAYIAWLGSPGRVGFCVRDGSAWSVVVVRGGTRIGDRCDGSGRITGLVGGGLPPDP